MRFDSYRIPAINRNLNKIGIRPLDVMVTGVTGAGKSTTLNAFFQKTVAKVGDGVDPETMELDAYRLNDFLRLWDTPGLGDGVAIDGLHERKMIDLLHKTYTLDDQSYGFIDMCIVVIEGSNRDMGTTYKLLNEVIVPHIQRDRILAIINQADVAMKGRHWNHTNNIPDSTLRAYLEDQALSVQRRVKEATGVDIIKPVYYSAEYSWNVEGVFDMIIDNMPSVKRPMTWR